MRKIRHGGDIGLAEPLANGCQVCTEGKSLVK